MFVNNFLVVFHLHLSPRLCLTYVCQSLSCGFLSMFVNHLSFFDLPQNQCEDAGSHLS